MACTADLRDTGPKVSQYEKWDKVNETVRRELEFLLPIHQIP